MNFHKWRSSWNFAKKISRHSNFREFYGSLIFRGNEDVKNTARRELAWHELQCPYYILYPGIAKALLKVQLDVKSNVLRLPLQAIEVRFGEGHEPISWEGKQQVYKVQSLLLAEFVHYKAKSPGFCVAIDYGETDQEYPVTTYANFPIGEWTIEESLAQMDDYPSAREGEYLPHEKLLECIRIACGVCLLDRNDEELFQFDVLNADLAKFEETQDQKYIEKAKRRGKFGWVIGRKLGNDPTYVESHFQHYWVGPGRTQLVYKRRKGYLTHREKVKEIPTGFEEKK